MSSLSRRKSSCSISLDLDNLWSYLKIHGNDAWQSYPSYLNIFIPYVLKVLNDLDLTISFFVVGKDADQKGNEEPLQRISTEKHEICNHSYNHDSWMHLLSKEIIKKEILDAEEAILRVSGQKTSGFRSPGFSWSSRVLETLSDLDYEYDASTLPTFIGPLARLYYFKTANLTKEERQDRRELFGSFSNGLLPVKPYNWNLNYGKHLLEIPVSTIPFIKIPFHLSYLIYLNNISPLLMKAYLNTAINLCLLTKTEPSFLLHPLDLIGGDQIKELAFFPGMNVNSHQKTKIFIEVINQLRNSFEMVTMGNFVKSIQTIKNIKSKNIESSTLIRPINSPSQKREKVHGIK